MPTNSEKQRKMTSVRLHLYKTLTCSTEFSWREKMQQNPPKQHKTNRQMNKKLTQQNKHKHSQLTHIQVTLLDSHQKYPII